MYDFLTVTILNAAGLIHLVLYLTHDFEVPYAHEV